MSEEGTSSPQPSVGTPPAAPDPTTPAASAPAPSTPTTPAAAPPPSTPTTPADPPTGSPTGSKDTAGADAPEPGLERAKVAFSQVRTAGIMVLLIGAGLLALDAYNLTHWPTEPPRGALDDDGGDLTVRLIGVGEGAGQVTVLALDGGQIGTGATDRHGNVTFENLQDAGVRVQASAGNQSWERRVFAHEGAPAVVLTLKASDPASSEEWTGMREKPGGAAVFVQVLFKLIIMAGGTAMILRRGYYMAVFGAALLVGMGLVQLLAGDWPLAIGLGGLGVWSILLCRRARRLFGATA